MAQPCLECHRAEGCGKEKLIGEHSHPIEVSLEDPSKTELPLYTLEGKKDPKGMVFCSTCHNSHQWNPRDPENKAEDGTSADSFLRQTSAGSSLLCNECHEDKAYIEGTDHDLRVTATDEKNRQDLFPQESGLCGSCHAVHNAQAESFIWNKDFGPSITANWNEEFSLTENMMIGMCTSCHQEAECAAQKVPEYGLHPNRIYMAMLQEKTDFMGQEEYEKYLDQFPVFTNEGEKSVEGDIVCSTCHDVHLWDAHHQRQGPGEEIEGNATNSFLRKNISFTFCASCHGEDAIFLFKYFHSLKGRIKEVPFEQEEQRDNKG
jgi:hypothetical protein